MKNFLQPIGAAVLAVIFMPGPLSVLAATIEWVNPAPLPPGASAPLPAQTSEPHQPASGTRSSSPLPRKPSLNGSQVASRPPPERALEHARPSETAGGRSFTESSAASGTASSPLVTQAKRFIDSYWEKTNGGADRVLPYLRSVYAPLIDYYGAEKSRASVLQDKSSFIRRWPFRQTLPLAGAENPTISCNDAVAECEITGLRGFEAVSPDRRAHSVGVVRYSYTVRFSDGTPQIVAEDSEVVKGAGIRAESPPAEESPSDLSQK